MAPARIGDHIRSNVLGLVAIFIALGGTATASHLAIYSSDIMDGEVRTADIATDAVTSAKIAAGQVQTTDLSFDPATQAELNVHKTSADHDGRYFTEAELRTSDGSAPNTGSNRVNWNNLVGVPAGFADGIDNGSGGGAASDLQCATACVQTSEIFDGAVTGPKLGLPLSLSGSTPTGGTLVHATNSASNATAVAGTSPATGADGVAGLASGAYGDGLYGLSTGTSGTGVHARATAAGGAALRAVAEGSAKAAEFTGPVQIDGTTQLNGPVDVPNDAFTGADIDESSLSMGEAYHAINTQRRSFSNGHGAVLATKTVPAGSYVVLANASAHGQGSEDDEETLIACEIQLNGAPVQRREETIAQQAGEVNFGWFSGAASLSLSRAINIGGSGGTVALWCGQGGSDSATFSNDDLTLIEVAGVR